MKILVIDDDRGMRQTVARILTSGGHEVAVAEDGEHGLMMFHLDRPDLVICDLIMPHRDGIATIAQIRREAPAMKIIAISGGGETMNAEGLATALEGGADEIIVKPFRAEEMLTLVATLLGQQQPFEPPEAG